MKKFLSMLVAVIMVLSIASAPASALSYRVPVMPLEDMNADFTIAADKTSVQAGEQVSVTMSVTGSYTFHDMIVGVTYETGSFTYIAMNEEEEPGDPAVGGEDPYFEYGTVATKLPSNAMKTASYVAGSDGRDKLQFGAILPTTGRSTQGDIGSFIFVALEDAEIGDHTFEIAVKSFDYAPQGEEPVAIPCTTSIPSVTVAVEGEVPPTPEYTVTFVDGVDNATLGTMTVEEGYTLVETDFPEVPEHEGYTFTAWSVDIGTAITADTTVTAQYEEVPAEPNIIWDFETDPVAQGFIIENHNTSAKTWEWTANGTSTHYQGTGYMSVSYASTANDAWLITPAFTGSSISFWANATSNSYPESLNVLVSTDNGANWTLLEEYVLSSTALEERTVDLSAYAGQTLRVAFQNVSQDKLRCVLDYITVPDGELVVMNCTVTFVDGYDGSIIGTVTLAEGETLTEEMFPAAPEHEDYTFTGWDVEAGTVIRIDTTVTANYQSDKLLIWDFETDPIAQGFLIENHGQGNTWVWIQNSNNSGNNTHYEGEGFMRVTYSSQQNDAWLITPNFKGDSISFWTNNYSSYPETMNVLVSTDNGANWTQVATYTVSNNTPQELTVDLGDYTDQAIRVAFQNVSTNQYYQMLDYITVENGELVEVACTVTFVDGITENVIGTIQVAAGSTLAETDFPTVPEHEGYTFTGWDYVDGTVINTDITVIAQFASNPTVTFVDGYTGGTIETRVVDYGTVLTESDFPELPDHQDAGYVFVEWDYDESAITEDITITAIFDCANKLIWDFNTSSGDPIDDIGFTIIDKDGESGYSGPATWTWQTGSNYTHMHDEDGAMYVRYGNEPSDWLITPFFRGDSISFWVSAGSSNYDEHFNLYVSETGDDWDELEPVKSYTVLRSTSNEPEQLSYNLSAYAGKLIKVAFEYDALDKFGLYIDYITVNNGETPTYTLHIDTDEGCTVEVFSEDENGWGASLADGAAIRPGQVLTVVASAKTGYVLDNDPSGTITVNGDVTVTATSKKAAYKLELSINDEAAADAPSARVTDMDAIEHGTDVTVVAADPNSGYKFVGWFEAGSSKLVSMETEFTFTMLANRSFMAKYEATEGHTVTWMAYNRVIKTMTNVTEITAEDYPEAPTPMPGFVFEGWNRNANYVNRLLKKGNVTVKAKFVEAPAETTIVLTVYNGEAVQPETIEYEVSTWVEITAAEVEGKSFAYWTLNDELLTYNNVAQFRITESCTLRAYYTEGAAEATAMLRTATYNDAADALTFTAEVTVPENAVITTVGMLTKAGTMAYGLTTGNCDGNYAVYTGFEGTSATATWTKTGVAIGDIWTVRTYVIYTIDGIESTVYGENTEITAGNDYDVTELGTAVITSYQYLADVAKAQFIAYLTVPEGGVIVKAGLVAAEQGYNDIDFNEVLLTAENAHFVKNHQLAVGTNGPVNYTWTKTNVQPGDIWFARAYLVYTLDGVEHTVYGALVRLIAE